jgi:hypothetical protein
MSVTARDEDRVVDDARIDSGERSLYRIVAYCLVAFVVFHELGRRFLPELVASGAAVFLTALGSWFIDGSKRSRMSLPIWISFCAMGAVLVALIVYALGRLWSLA